MKALVLNGRAQLTMMDVPEPNVGKDDILIRVKACGICGSDMSFYTGRMEPMRDKPTILGHEFAGDIVAMGQQVSDYWQIGMRVVSDNTGAACGRCPSCSAGHFVACSNRATIGAHMDGGFAEYVRIPGEILNLFPNCLYRIPECMSYEEATMMDPAANGYNAVVQQGRFMSGETVVVFGCGPLGLMALQQAHLAGASKAIMVGLSVDKQIRFPIAEKLGATHVLAADEEPDLVGTIARIANDFTGISLVVDAAGDPGILDMGLALLRNEGNIVRIGTSAKPYVSDFNGFLGKNVAVIGHGGYNQTSWRNTFNLIESGRLDVRSVITHELPLSEYKRGFELLQERKAGKVVLSI